MGRIRNVGLGMNIYSNSFFHRVREVEVLELIIEQGFKCFYCKEEICNGQKSVGSIGIPMVSFSDIPLSHIARNNYGKCGLGMTRKWGNRMHLEPVLYYPNDKKCLSTKMVNEAYQAFEKTPKEHQKYRILGYSKPMNKSFASKGVPKDNYIEREWRKVYACPAPLKWLNEQEYNLYRGDKTLPKKPVGNILKFDPEDVVFIIIPRKDKEQILDFIVNKMNTFGGRQVTEQEKFDIVSKVIEYESLEFNL